MFQSMNHSPPRADNTVEAIGFDIDATWKSVSASTRSSLPAFRTPKPYLGDGASRFLIADANRSGASNGV